MCDPPSSQSLRLQTFTHVELSLYLIPRFEDLAAAVHCIVEFCLEVIDTGIQRRKLFVYCGSLTAELVKLHDVRIQGIVLIRHYGDK